MVIDFKTTILKIILDNNGKFNWYQIDRQLSWVKYGEYPIKLMEAIKQLIDEGLVEIKKGPNPSQPLYLVTEKGKQSFKSWVEERNSTKS